MKVQIGSKYVGEGESCFIIAEAGSNHNRKLDRAKKLIDIAVESGVDAVKFQTYSADTLYSKKTPRLSEMDRLAKSSDTPYELIKKLELPREWQKELGDYAKEKGIIFLSTPFDEKAIDELDEIGIPAFKIGSYELTHLPLIKYAAQKNKPIILSVGNSNLSDIEEALETIYSTENKDVIILHCVSQYPTQYEDVNLRVLKTLQRAFNVPIGFSDHTLDDTVAIAAVAFGACIIEKHFTLDRTLDGPDHSFAMEPNQLKQMVINIRNVEKAMGSPIKKVNKSEEENHKLARRSIHAKVNIPKGTKITSDMLCIKRPALGIKPALLDVIIGRTARIDIEEDSWITWDMI